MKLAHVTATFPPHYTGTGNVALNNAREAARHGHDVHVYTPHVAGAPMAEMMGEITVHRPKAWLRNGNAFFMPTLIHHLRRFDLVHLHMPFYGGAEAIHLLHQWTRIPLVITFHQDVQLDGWRGVVSHLHDEWIGTPLLHSADRLCFTSLDYAQSSRYARLLHQQGITVVDLPNGVDATRFQPAPSGLEQQLRDRYKLHGMRVILFVGALDRAHYFKGVDVLLNAFAGLNRGNLALLLVGKGDMLAEYKETARQSPAFNRIHFAGFVPDAELPAYYRLADATVLPSTTAGEAFGLVLVESMACATPVIASALPGVRSVVDHERNGFLAAPGDAADLQRQLERLLTLPPQEHLALGQAGRAKVEERYAWKRIGTQLDALYRDVLPSGLAPDSTHRVGLQKQGSLFGRSASSKP